MGKKKDQPTKDQLDVLPDPYIEHWNNQSHVPKCRPGSKAYELCRKFFEAHRRFAIGRNPWFLSEEYQKKLDLSVINHEKQSATGNRPEARPDAEMFEHIEQAALAFNPEYNPQTKKCLGRSLQSFLYNGFSTTQGQTSRFLQYVSSPATRLDDVEALWDKQTEQIQNIVCDIEYVYKAANHFPESRQLDDSELRHAIRIAHKFYAEYKKMDREFAMRLCSTLDYKAFMALWKRKIINYDLAWEGISIAALDVKGNVWKKFIHVVQAEVHCDLYTGEEYYEQIYNAD